MAGILEHVFNVRTNGNGRVRSEWDDILLPRDLDQLIGEGRVKLLRDVPGTSKYLLADLPSEARQKWVEDAETGDVYEYGGPCDRVGATFRKVDLDDRFRALPNSKLM